MHAEQLNYLGKPIASLLLAALVIWMPRLQAQSLTPPAAQTASITSANPSFAALPDTPTPRQTGSISGTISGVNGTYVHDAEITLTAAAGETHTMLSAADGRFQFTGLLPATYTLTVKSAGLAPFKSSTIDLAPGQSLHLPELVLAVGGTTTEVRVTSTQVEIAQEQIREAEHQRALGVFPNFYSSYSWDAEPLTKHQKFDLAFHSILDPVGFATLAVAAGVQQANDTFHDYGQGAQGYAKYYGAGYADTVSGRMLGSAILPSLFHQDPRYFYKGTGTRRQRITYALSRAVLTRSDHRTTQPNYSLILGAFAAGGIANLYHPSSDRGFGLTFSNGAIDIAGHAADNLVREFVLRHITPGVPRNERGEPSS